MVQHLAERTSCDANELSKLLVFESAHMPFGNIPRSGSGSVRYLGDQFVLVLEAGPSDELVDSQL